MIWAALSLAPQIFYTLYRAIIPGLPAQWIAGLLPLQEFAQSIRIHPESSLAQLATGVLVLSTLLATAIAWIDFSWGCRRITNTTV